MKTLMKLGCTFVLILFISNAVMAQTETMSEQEYDQYLINFLNDENIGIRTSAAQLLGERKVQEAVEPLIKMLKTEEKYCARLVAALALYQIGDKKALPVLKKVAVRDKNKVVRNVTSAIVRKMENDQYAQK